MILKCSTSDCRWRRRKEARPEEILEAALQLFAEKGFSAARMVDVAKAAGISKGTLYLYFDSKEAIFRELVISVLNPMVDQAESSISEFTGSKAELLHMFITNWWQHMTSGQISAIPKLVISESGNFPEMAEFFTHTIVKRVRNMITKVIREGIETKEFIACDAESAARLLMAPLIQASIWRHSLKPFDDTLNEKNYINLHLDLFLKGIKKEQYNAK